MVKLNKNQNFGLYFKYALRDLTRSYNKISSIIITLFISLFILSSIMTIEDSLENELNENAKLLLGGDIEIDYNNREGDQTKIDKITKFATVYLLTYHLHLNPKPKYQCSFQIESNLFYLNLLQLYHLRHLHL